MLALRLPITLVGIGRGGALSASPGGDTARENPAEKGWWWGGPARAVTREGGEVAGARGVPDRDELRDSEGAGFKELDDLRAGGDRGEWLKATVEPAEHVFKVLRGMTRVDTRAIATIGNKVEVAPLFGPGTHP
jgi:hypothetical protein